MARYDEVPLSRLLAQSYSYSSDSSSSPQPIMPRSAQSQVRFDIFGLVIFNQSKEWKTPNSACMVSNNL